MCFDKTFKSMLVIKTLTKRFLKTPLVNKKTKIRCLFILFSIATHKKDIQEIIKLLKRIEKVKKDS